MCFFAHCPTIILENVYQVIIKNTIKNRLLRTFFFFTLIIVFLSSSSIYFSKKASNVKQFGTTVDKLHADLLKLIKTDIDFFAFEPINTHFFKTGNSPYLDDRKVLFTKINHTLEELIKSKTSNDFKIEKDLKLIREDLRSYDSIFKNMMNRLYKRGFYDYGLIGQMRNSAHALENHTEKLSLEIILSLRRHEKDFMLRSNMMYAEKLNNLSKAILEKLNKDQEENELLIYYLKDYTEKFNQLVEHEMELGLRFHTGLKNMLDNHSRSLSAQFENILDQTEENEYKLLRNINITFIITVISCVLLSILFSYITAQRLNKPITRLMNDIKDIAENNFNRNVKIPKEISTEEIRLLRAVFAEMVRKIRSQLALINQNASFMREKNEELKAANEKLQHSENKLRDSNQIKDKFFSILAHDLKSPLATIQSFLNILIRHSDGFSKEEITSLAKEMSVSVTNLGSLLENLLEWSRTQMGSIRFNPSPINLCEIGNENIQLHESRAKNKKIELSMDCLDEKMAYADSHMVDFIMRNLVSNAIKFTYPGGQVKLIIGSEDGNMKISVIDNGKGMSAEQIKALFKKDSFASTKGTQNERGTGLGLMLCKEFAETQDGSLVVKSKEGEGSEFILFLPPARMPVKALN